VTRKTMLFGLVVFAALSNSAYADTDLTQLDANVAATKKAAAKQGWQGSVSLGYLATTGNTNTRSFNGQALAAYRSDPWQDTLSFQALKSSQNGVTTAENYDLNGQSDYNFTENNYVFGMLDYLRDTFSGYQRRTSEILGYGRRLLVTDTQQLDVEAGAGARQTLNTDNTSENGIVEMLAANYLWKFTEKSNFSENLSVMHGVDSTFTQSVTALTTNLAGDFALSISYTVKHNSSVPPGFKNSDTITAISLVYTF
jgi:putative salt-induced outer membrane protein